MRELLNSWDSYSVIVGSVAGALIGLQFVVMALVADSDRRANMGDIAAFGTPTVLHFSAALLLAAVLSVPWSSFAGARLIIGGCGVAGIVYVGIVIRRAWRSEGYRAEMEDWIWHAALPLLAYGGLVAAALPLSEPGTALDVVAASSLALVFIGIHNAWDTVTYLVTEAARKKRR